MLDLKLAPLVATLALGACASEPVASVETASPAEAEVIYTDRLAHVSLPVACAEFGGVLGFVSDTLAVNDPATVARLRLAASQATAVPDSAHEMDARLIAVVRDGGSADTLCVGGYHSAEVNGVPVRDSALVRLLWAVASP